ncbi:hypothetical protein EV700_0736 [Fluviicoccus keumensis]|uniref:Uncharacterized protein n=1 Tax=Fluviicoccus keumensis TaxID=1435465 RepID=A0A4Q7ZCZ7_9GAMM|nr:hypothetical protein [Fluviicoccus keumensis]RZU47769.1 hypothetical protein EV700_0736 [Fluviicoccus keumensis]
MTGAGEVILVEEDAVCFTQADPCPRSWNALRPTADDTVRICGTCGRTVHFCSTPEEALAKASDQQAVATPLFRAAAAPAPRFRAA